MSASILFYVKSRPAGDVSFTPLVISLGYMKALHQLSQVSAFETDL
jgi:hypothetical protein